MKNKKNEKFPVSLLADIHLGYKELRKAVAILNQYKDIDFVFVPGDITDTGIKTEYIAFYDILTNLNYLFMVL